MASAGERISEVAKQEGDNSKGSTAAQMQSNLSKGRNLEETAEQVAGKVASNPSSVTEEDAQTLQSRTSRYQRGGQPPSDSLAAQAQSVAAGNDQGVGSNTTSTLTAEQQSQLDREANYKQQADYVTKKLETEPGNVTREDGNTMHSREQRAFRTTEKGGLSSAAKSQVAENEGTKK
ncbi:uncharacterized protein KY384_005427 [Bacidia gigantensis]|uniref:uncharacterized protein n=1 Tax=Bacidia gigantensis TaxID=2732470 RepID=UPI001D03BC33|nr:uncharacterized protein KY384_005427 [Bacidia gigantensis]KAG8529946.1 hypothetical protein KY384_005427 [Bacidia gigantensis]